MLSAGAGAAWRGAAAGVAPAVDTRMQALGLRASLRHIADSPYLRSIAWVIGLSSFATTIAGWQFKAMAKAHVPDTDQLAAFFGIVQHGGRRGLAGAAAGAHRPRAAHGRRRRGALHRAGGDGVDVARRARARLARRGRRRSRPATRCCAIRSTRPPSSCCTCRCRRPRRSGSSRSSTRWSTASATGWAGWPCWLAPPGSAGTRCRSAGSRWRWWRRGWARPRRRGRAT